MRCQPSLNRQILALAVPALGALAAEPLFLLTDTAMVGHLGETALAALAIAQTIIQTTLGLMIFLAYATTPRVAHRLGAGDTRGAVSAGFDGMWLALAISLLLLCCLPLLPWLISQFSPPVAVASAALDYVTISWWGLPCMLLVIASTGLLRGLHDTRTPLVIATCGFLANIALNYVFIYIVTMGVAGSALGSVIANAVMCMVYVAIAIRAAKKHGSQIRPNFTGVFHAAINSVWLLIRNLSLRSSLIILVAIATSLGTTQLAAVQVVQSLFFSLALILDSLAIAGQALIGVSRGAGDKERMQHVTRRLVYWGVISGVIAGVILAVTAPVLAQLFTSDNGVSRLLTGLIWILAASLPLAGYVFTLDGVLMGAEDVKYLAGVQIMALAAFCLVLSAVWIWPHVYILWACFACGFMLARGVGLGWRYRKIGFA